ncbi:MAG: hypothetical protein E7046_10240 [Lentisphaerae bacterium]|nr:hypothetical protein [Lentisphaerota bacterium]
MAEETYTTKLKIEADTKGADQAAAAYEKSGRAAKKASEESKKGFEGLKKSIEGTSRAAEIFNKVLSGFGFIGIFTMVVGIVDKLRNSFSATTAEAKKFAEEARKAADTARVEKLADAWKKLEDQISNASAAQSRANELEDMQRDNARKLEDDQTELAKQKELAALDPNDPLYEKKKAQIEAKHSAAAAKRSVARRQEDANIAADRAGNEAAAMSTEAMKRSLALTDERAELERLRRERSRAIAASTADNHADAQGVGGAFLNNIKNILSLDWGKVGDMRTDEGDAIREDAKKRADELEKQIKDKEAQIAAQERKISELQSGADHLTQKATLHRGAAFGAETAMETASLAGSAAVSAADKAVTDEQTRIADAHRARAALTAQQAQLKAQIATAQGRKDAAGLAVFNAQGAVDLAKANGGKGLAGAQGALADAQSTALSTNASADRLIAALTKALNDVNTKLKAAQTAIESQSKQTRYAWSEAPAGD